MSFEFHPSFFANLDQEDFIPTIDSISPAEIVINEFLNSTPEATVEQLIHLNQMLLNSEFGDTVQSNSRQFLTKAQLLNAAQIYDEYVKNQWVINKAINALIKTYKEPEKQKPVPSFETVESIVKCIMKRNTALMQSIPRFSEKEIQKYGKRAIGFLPNINHRNFQNWSRLTDAFFGIMYQNEEYAKKLAELPFEQYQNKVEDLLNRLKQYAIQNNKLVAPPVENPSDPHTSHKSGHKPG